MSMISAQCDELRKIADELQNLIDNGHSYTWSGLFSTLHYAQQGLRSAADTIWELSCKLADVVDQSEEINKRTAELDFQIADNWRLTTENESLKEQNAKLRDAMYCNAKKRGLQHMGADELRVWATRQAELIDALRRVAKDMYPSYCYANGGNGETYLTYEQDADIRDRVRELGVLDE